MEQVANKIIKNQFCKDCESDNLIKEYYDDRIESYCDCGFEKDYLIGEDYFKNEEEIDNAEGIICRCGSKSFSIDLKAFITDVKIDNFKNIISCDMKNVEFDLDSYIEYCYCSKCGAELNYN